MSQNVKSTLEDREWYELASYSCDTLIIIHIMQPAAHAEALADKAGAPCPGGQYGCVSGEDAWAGLPHPEPGES